MALSFATASGTLVNWGFSVGDVAALYSAGRSVGNWLTAQWHDRNLFEFFNVDVDAVVSRKGLIDMTSLHERWDSQVTLLKNGQRTSIQANPSARIPVLEPMDRFSWLMTLLTAALDASMQNHDLREVISLFMQKLFEETESGKEFLKLQADQHISGWRSAACVRNISFKAHNTWEHLAREGKHQPGYVPSADKHEILRLMLWLVNGKSDERVFQTSSTDAYSFAVVLEDIGILIKSIENEHYCFDESHLVIIWNDKIPYSLSLAQGQRTARAGMRIPLAHMEEVASLYPWDRNELRRKFEIGMQVVEDDGLDLHPRLNFVQVENKLASEDNEDIIYEFRSSPRGPSRGNPRLESDVYRLADCLFPVGTPASCNALIEIARTTAQGEIRWLINILERKPHGDFRMDYSSLDNDYDRTVTHLQAFILGYWYRILLPLLDTTQMTTADCLSNATQSRSNRGQYAGKEAFGSWGWSDLSCFGVIRETVRTKFNARPVPRKQTFFQPRPGSPSVAQNMPLQQEDEMRLPAFCRHDILKLASYLFGGADLSQIQSVKSGAVGVIGKLPLVYSSLLGGSLELIGRFSLLDVDSSSIPSRASGIVVPGRSHRAVPKLEDQVAYGKPSPLNTRTLQGHFQNLACLPHDEFTSHIEPDWEYDVHSCLIAYRHRGRIVHRLNPRQVDVVLSRQLLNLDEDENSSEVLSRKLSERISLDLLPLQYMEGGFVFMVYHASVCIQAGTDSDLSCPIIVNTSGSQKALVCVTCMYDRWYNSDTMALAFCQEHLARAIAKRRKVIVASKSMTVLP